MLVQPALQSVAVGATQLQQLQIRTNLSNDFHVLKVKHVVGQACTTNASAVESSLLPVAGLLRPRRCAELCFSVAVQECARWLPPCLTRLDVSYIGAPFGRSSLERLFASLPALEFVRLHFRTAVPDGLEHLSDSDGEQQSSERMQHDDFPLSLLRWVLLSCLCHTPYRPAAALTGCLLCCLVVMSLAPGLQTCHRRRWLDGHASTLNLVPVFAGAPASPTWTSACTSGTWPKMNYGLTACLKASLPSSDCSTCGWATA